MSAAAFICAACSNTFCWGCERPVPPDTEVKTIGSRYCAGCIGEECAAHNLPRYQVLEMRQSMWGDEKCEHGRRTWTLKHRPSPRSQMVCEYECPEHGVFDATVERDDAGDPPNTVACFEVIDEHTEARCGEPSEWRPSAPLTRVKQGEVSQGKFEPPPFAAALDTRALADGMPLSEWKRKRAALRQDERRKKVKEMLS